MKVALFDHFVSGQSPAGSCDLRLLEALRDEHEFTVFSSDLALQDGGGAITHVSMPTLRRPALASFLTYFLRSLVSYGRLRLGGSRFDIVQATDCALPTADICYAHFCHRAFLAEVWPQVRRRLSARTLHSWAEHAVRATIEAILVRRARVIVVPSDGLKRDLERVYPGVLRKVTVIRNTVDLGRLARPPEFDRRRIRARLRTGEADAVFVFVALGHFERKGLPLLLEALRANEFEGVRLWVVGGEAGLVASYASLADRLGVSERVNFVGRARDVRPYLWSADAFVAPSHYEAFSLGLLEAAAAGLPLIATRISGSEELLEHGVNGFAIERSADGVRAGMRKFIHLTPDQRAALGRAARESVEPLNPERFAESWRTLYASLSNVNPSRGGGSELPLEPHPTRR